MKEWVCPDCETGRKFVGEESRWSGETAATEAVVEAAVEEKPFEMPDSVHEEPVQADVKYKSAKGKEPQRKVHPLFLKHDPGYFRPQDVEWDGDSEHIPAEWRGRWVVVENDGYLDDRHILHVVQVALGCLMCSNSGRAVITTPYSSVKNMLRPGLFSTREAAELAVVHKFEDDMMNSRCEVAVNRQNPLLTAKCIREVLADGKERLHSYPWFAVMRIEELRLRRKSDIWREIREIREKEMGLPKNPQSKPVQQFGSAAVPSRTEPAVDGHPKPGMTDYADYLIRQKENREKGILYTPYRRKSSAKSVGRDGAVASAHDNLTGPSTSPSIVPKPKEWYVIKDRNSDSYLRVPNHAKGEEGDAWLESDVRNCTVFKTAVDANNVATSIERMFWNRAYAKMNLHVCLLCDELPAEGKGGAFD